MSQIVTHILEHYPRRTNISLRAVHCSFKRNETQKLFASLLPYIAPASGPESFGLLRGSLKKALGPQSFIRIPCSILKEEVKTLALTTGRRPRKIWRLPSLLRLNENKPAVNIILLLARNVLDFCEALTLLSHCNPLVLKHRWLNLMTVEYCRATEYIFFQVVACA